MEQLCKLSIDFNCVQHILRQMATVDLLLTQSDMSCKYLNSCIVLNNASGPPSLMLTFVGWIIICKHTDPNTKFHGANMGPICGDKTQVGPMLAPWTLLSGDAKSVVRYIHPSKGAAHDDVMTWKHVTPQWPMNFSHWEPVIQTLYIFSVGNPI